MLTIEQLQAIEQLQKECEKEDNMQLKLNWEMLQQREDQSMDFFHMENGELVAYLALYGFGSTVEVCGMVKPSERRKRYFSTLWNEAVKTIEKKGFQKVLLNAPASLESAKGWLAEQSCTYGFSEFQMMWEKQPMEESNEVLVRDAQKEDENLEVLLDVLAFHMSKEDARAHYERVKKNLGEQYFMIEADGQTVGKIRVSRMDGEAWIYGFSVLPQFQGKGYGRKALRNVVKKEHEAGYSVHLEVETKNEHALRLYESIGFTVVHGQDYYLWN
ncbi:GNAT family N-acetyltransferase [Lederbergia citrea]|uniref:GNAT family N-acetyltransferase n=1 Tax=Lederbergia citrea TaxID=2833581 RepID=UPI001BC9C169|nr:GNAT family N-acetyltransferase [Lederbergia citrea]MBS4179086.1 GNAT family N-acetyltransferase [Lederbergia citrea]